MFTVCRKASIKTRTSVCVYEVDANVPNPSKDSVLPFPSFNPPPHFHPPTIFNITNLNMFLLVKTRGPSFLQLLSSLGQIFLDLESVLQPTLHFARYLIENLMDHIEIFRKLNLDLMQQSDVVYDDVTISRDWKLTLNYGN